MKKKIVIITLPLLLIITLVVYLNKNSQTPTGPILFEGATMGTSYHIKVIPTRGTQIDAKVVSEKIIERLDDIDHLMSTYKNDSEISLFNQHQENQWFRVSKETLNVIQAGQQVSKLSDGAFDMTIGNLVNLWGFGPTINLDSIPQQNKIDALIGQIGYQKLQLSAVPPQLLKTSLQVYLDLSAIAKGYAVDAIAKVLLNLNIEHFMVEIGGEIVTRGFKSENNPWVIGIQTPDAVEQSVQKRLYLTDIAMATSGDYRNYFEQDGVRYSHTIDPLTGHPINHQLASVTVVSSTCMLADAYATAIMVLGPTKGMDFANKNNIAIFMIIKEGEDFTERNNELFTHYLTK
ncbi:MAG: FAD:protein FMN transferase [Deltaproteobacteria bacterium]|nr:FAD:protein FMN transferase [Deltaproteobacteria bacterium]